MVGINGNGKSEQTACEKRAIENDTEINAQTNERGHRDESRKAPKSTVHLFKHDECTWMDSSSPWTNVSDEFEITDKDASQYRKRKLNAANTADEKETLYGTLVAGGWESQKASNSPVDMSNHVNCTGMSLRSHGTNASYTNPDITNHQFAIVEVESDVTDESQYTSQDEAYESVTACGQDESGITSISTVDTYKHENRTGKFFAPPQNKRK